jgi:hypothetical protein
MHGVLCWLVELYIAQIICLFFLFPAGVAFTWFIFDALSDDIKKSVGLYWDPDAELNRVEMERAKRLEARAALKQKKPVKDVDDEEEEDNDDREEEEDEATAETVAAAVAKAVEAADDDDDEEEDDAGPATESNDEGEDEEEESAEKSKKPKVDFNSLSNEEKWDFLAFKFVEPGEDDDDEDDVSKIPNCSVRRCV